LETDLAATIAKRRAPVDVVTDQTKATYDQKSSEIRSRRSQDRINQRKDPTLLVRFLCQKRGQRNLSVQLIEASSTGMVWAYSVNTQLETAARTIYGSRREALQGISSKEYLAKK
jgi:TolB-like protein